MRTHFIGSLVLMATPTRQAFANWILYLIVFLVFGGIGAGVVALLFEAIIGQPFSNVLYAVIFGGSGLIAYHALRRAREESGSAVRSET